MNLDVIAERVLSDRGVARKVRESIKSEEEHCFVACVKGNGTIYSGIPMVVSPSRKMKISPITGDPLEWVSGSYI